MNIKILVATHKPYRMPEDDIYYPIQVGRENYSSDFGFQSDNIGDNISYKNLSMGTLTAIYWAWKNINADYIGLTHYRRHFSSCSGSDKWMLILKRNEIENFLKKTDIVLPKRRKYYIETVYSQYVHSHKPEPLEATLDIIKDDYPDYVKACEIVMKRNWLHLFNMFIMSKEKFDSYCKWLFDIIFKLEKRIDISKYSLFESRVFGRISERLMDVWIVKNNYTYLECPVQFMESQNWIHKGGEFLLRKLRIVKMSTRY
jgi:hypothetical protein